MAALIVLILQEVLDKYIEYQQRRDEAQHEQQHANNPSVTLVAIGNLLAHEVFLHKPHHKDTGEHCAKRHQYIGCDVIKDCKEINTEQSQECNRTQSH